MTFILFTGVYSIPKKCRRKGCRSLTFLPQVSSHLTQTINWQCVRLQEIIADEHVCFIK